MADTEMHVVLRYGKALLTIQDGRTALTSMVMTADDFTFHIVAWCPTYEEALTLAQVTAYDEALAALTT